MNRVCSKVQVRANKSTDCVQHYLPEESHTVGAETIGGIIDG